MDTIHRDTTFRQLSDVDHQLRMFAKIKELYNIDFDLEVKKLEKRADQLRQLVAVHQGVPRAM